MKEFFDQYYKDIGSMVDSNEWIKCKDKMLLEIRVPVIVQKYLAYIYEHGLAGYAVNTDNQALFEENMFLDAFLTGLERRWMSLKE